MVEVHTENLIDADQNAMSVSNVDADSSASLVFLTQVKVAGTSCIA